MKSKHMSAPINNFIIKAAIQESGLIESGGIFSL